MENNRIILFGGSFDPIHNGHKSSVDVLRKEFPDSTILILPSINKLKDKSLIPLEERIASVKSVFHSYSNVNVLDWSLHWDTSSTFKVVSYIKKSYPNGSVYVAAGEDIISSLPKWKYYRKVVKNINWIFFLRNSGVFLSENVNPEIQEMINCSVLLKTPCLKISSTLIKQSPKNHINDIPREARPIVLKYLK